MAQWKYAKDDFRASLFEVILKRCRLRDVRNYVQMRKLREFLHQILSLQSKVI
jgi:hypothetical protein